MTEAMPFLRKCDITFLRPPPFRRGVFFLLQLYCRTTALTFPNSVACRPSMGR